MTPGRALTGMSGFLFLVAGLFAAMGYAGPDPAKWLLHQSGFAALVFLSATLAISTFARALRQPRIVVWRRAVGLAGFFFATVHVVVYVTVFQGLLLSAMVDDVVKRPYILVGLIAWLMLIPMAATSTKKARREMGVAWIRLHRLIYLIVPLAIFHQGLAQKADVDETLIFSAIVGCFLIERVVRAAR